MAEETPFRIALVAILCAMMAIMVYHRLQAARAGDRISRTEEGLALAIALRGIGGGALALATLAYLVDPAWMAWAQVPLPSWLRWLGAIVGSAFVGFLFWTMINLGKNLTDTVVTRAHATLVTSGPYRWVRHPFYVSIGMLTLAMTLLAANWFMAAGGILVLTLLVIRTDKEEQNLAAKFGDSYREYMATTGRFMPTMRHRRR